MPCIFHGWINSAVRGPYIHIIKTLKSFKEQVKKLLILVVEIPGFPNVFVIFKKKPFIITSSHFNCKALVQDDVFGVAMFVFILSYQRTFIAHVHTHIREMLITFSTFS